MAGTSRWWGPRSQFPWEEDALAYVRGLLPDAEPYRAWHTFTFTAATGHVREVDLFLATPSGLYLVEIKSHPGVATNNGSTWMFDAERFRSVENPLHLTNLKCKELRGRLEWAAGELGLNGVRIPWIEPAVFLSAPDLECRFDDNQRIGVYGRDDRVAQTGLPGVGAGLLGVSGEAGPHSGPHSGRHAQHGAPGSRRGRLDPRLSRQLGALLDKVGIQGLRKHGRIGPYELARRSFDAGPTWEDYLADNTALPGDAPRRIRLYLSELGAAKDARESTRRAARREYLALQGIQHPGIVTAESYSDEHEAGPAVVFRHHPAWQRLDLYMAERGDRLDPETRVEMVRQLAEALDHAHRRHLYHRALAARSVYVEQDGYYPRLRIADWQVAARPGGSSPTASPTASPTTTHGAAGRHSLVAHIEGSAAGYLAPEFGSVDADSIPLDVFGLGALAYVILTGRPPAASRAELERRLGERGFLVPSAAVDGISPVADDLVRGATGQQPCDRYDTVGKFLDDLELLERDVYAADDDVVDPLDAGVGATVSGWRVERVLGTGSTARALLVSRDGVRRVLKVALNSDAAPRLAGEAGCLAKLGDSRVVRLIDGPAEVAGRTYIALEEAGDITLGENLRREGKLTIDELENYGEDLLRAVEYLEEQDVWHRDIKPDNLAIRRTAKKKRRRLVLFDFSLAVAPDTATRVGTQPYLDPFLGPDRRPRYDGAAERYAVAVTLHEMASGELPSWGDGVTEPRLLDEEMPQLAEDSLDPSLREELVAFFQRALHRDARRRYDSLRAMRRAWEDVFRGLAESRPPTTPHTIHDEPPDADAARDAAAAVAAAETTLEQAGLSPRALSVAERDLRVTTVGELMRKPATQIQRLRGVGLGVRNELVKRARQWRRALQVAEPPAAAPAGPAAAGADDRAALDDVAGRLVPRDTGRNSTEVAVVRLALALPDGDGSAPTVSSWPAQREIADWLGLSQPYVATLLSRARDRWARTPVVTDVRVQIVEALGEHGRVLESRQLARELLARRGSRLADPQARLALAAAAVRAATYAEERRDDPRLLTRRRGDRVLVALCQVGDPAAPSDVELLDYAEALGERADELAGRDPLPSAATARRELRAVAAPDGMPELPDTDLVALAAAASANAAVTARFELYPRDLPADRALRLAQAASYLGGRGIFADKLHARVLDRFPELTDLPAPDELRPVLRGDLGLDVQYDAEGRLVLPSATQLSATSSARPRRGGTGVDDETLDEVWGRLVAARESGGFRAVTALPEEAVGAVGMLAALPGVTAISVSTEFVAALRENVTARGKPSWATVLAADSADASPAARTGFSRLVALAWERLDARVRSAGGVVLLHDVTPLARYTGGEETFARLAAAARGAATAPYGLWLLCPMPNPAEGPRMDDVAVGVHGPAEQIALPRGFIGSARPHVARDLAS